MSWTNQQKKTLVIACRDAGMTDEHRKLVLLQFPLAMHQGKPTSTSPRLTNCDFEQVMAVVERSANGMIPGFSRDYWKRKADDGLQRPRRLAQQIADKLAAGKYVQLEGFIRRMTADAKSALEQLTAAELYRIIEGLKHIARQNRVEIKQ